MSDDTTDTIKTAQVLREQIKALREVCERGFEQVNKRLDQQGADSKEIASKVHELEIFKAKEEAREEPAKIEALTKRIDALEKWRWVMTGAGVAAGAASGPVFQAISAAMGGG